MDTLSIPAAARRLNTSPPRVYRAVAKLGIQPVRTTKGARLKAAHLQRLESFLGATPFATNGVSREGLRVLAALDRRPFGVRSRRALARAAGVSPTTVRKVLADLVKRGAVKVDEVVLAEGRARLVEVISLVQASPLWASVSSDARRVELPAPPRREARMVPVRLRHHFWNASAANLRLPENAHYVALRLLNSGDPEAVAWALLHLPADAISSAADVRGLSTSARHLIRSVAANIRDDG